MLVERLAGIGVLPHGLVGDALCAKPSYVAKGNFSCGFMKDQM